MGVFKELQKKTKRYSKLLKNPYNYFKSSKNHQKMQKQLKDQNRSNEQIVNKQMQYQFLLEYIKDQLLNQKVKTCEDIDTVRLAFLKDWNSMVRHSDAVSAINGSQLFIGLNQRQCPSAFFKLKAKVGGSRLSVKKISVVRGYITVNNKKSDFKYKNISIAANCDAFIRAQMTIRTLCSILQPPRNQDMDRLKKDFIALHESFMKMIDEIDECIFEFNKVGGKFTRHYKLFSKFKLDKRLSNPLLAIGSAAFFQVYGGNYSKGTRFSRSINKLPGVKSEAKLTSDAIRKARLSRFEKDYLLIGKKITELSKKAQDQKHKILKVNKVLKDGITKQA